MGCLNTKISTKYRLDPVTSLSKRVSDKEYKKQQPVGSPQYRTLQRKLLALYLKYSPGRMSLDETVRVASCDAPYPIIIIMCLACDICWRVSSYVVVN